MRKDEQQKAWIKEARLRLENEALQYARLKSFGFYLERDGTRISVCGTDQKMYTEQFAGNVLRLAVDLLAELACETLPPIEPK